MPVQHLGREISVSLSEDEARRPLKFTLSGKEYQVAEVQATWQDHAYSGLPRGGRAWQGGRQRQYYRLRTAEGETFEIYVESPAGRKGRARWYASRRLAAAAASPAAETPLAAETPPTAETPPAAAPARRRRGG